MRLAVLAATLILATPSVTVKVYPPVVMAGGAVRLTCRVPRDARNRKLVYGLENYADGSERDLEGEQARITWNMIYEHVPCVVETAYCIVVRDDGSSERAVAHLEVAGCD